MKPKKLLSIVFFIFPILFIPFLFYFLMKFESHPSSTAGLGYIALPVIAAFSIIPGFILMMLGSYLGSIIESRTKYKSLPMISAIAFIFAGCIVAISTSALTGYFMNYRLDKKNEPRVVVKNEHIKKDDFKILNELEIDNWKFKENRNVFSEEFSTKTIDLENSKLTIRRQLKYSFWNGQKVYLCYDDSNAYILVEKSENIFKIIAKQNVRNISYISDIKGFEIDFNGEKCFALLTVLRATLQRSFLTIYSPEKKMIYQELTGRIRIITPVKQNNKEFLVTGDDRSPRYVYYWE